MSWPTKQLGDLVEFLDHRRRPITASDRRPGPFPYYGANGVQDHVADFIFDEPLVLLAEDGGHFDDPSRGIAYATLGKCWVNNHAHVLRPTNAVDHRYLTRVLENLDVRRHVTGTTRAKLTKAGASRIEVPLPPIEEQRRIADILDRADALRAKRRQAVVLFDDLSQSIFTAMFADMWPDGGTTLGSLCERITDGTHQPPNWAPHGHPFIFVKNIVSGEIDLSTDKFISDETHAELTRRCPIEIGDVLYSTVGSYGVPVVVRTSRKFAFQRHIAHLKPDRSRLLPEFLKVMLASVEVRRQADAAARGAAQKTVNLADIREYEVIAPRMELQAKFVETIAAVATTRAHTSGALQALDDLFVALQQRAFAGLL